MEQGKVKFFNVTRGYGFITTVKGEDVFFHKNDVKDAGFRTMLQQGDTVTFDLRDEPRGKRAFNVIRQSA
jgi:CspA family cold shock protein